MKRSKANLFCLQATIGLYLAGVAWAFWFASNSVKEQQAQRFTNCMNLLFEHHVDARTAFDYCEATTE